MVTRSTDKDDAAGWLRLQIQFPTAWKKTTFGCAISPSGGAIAMGRDVFGGSVFEIMKGGMMKAGPNLALPSAIEIFDGPLKTGFAGWRKDRNDVQAQTQNE